MEVEKSFRIEDVEPRGTICAECLSAVSATEAVPDRCGATLCRTCAVEFYVACAVCGGLVPQDEALGRAGGELCCAECFGGASAPDSVAASIDESEVKALVAEYVALHAEKKQLDVRMDEIKESLKQVAAARPRVAGAVVLRDGEDAGVRCSYSVKTTYDAEKLSIAEELLGRESFASLFERKVTFAPDKESLEEFLSSTDEARNAAREAVRASAQQTEVATLNVVAQKKKRATRAE